MVLNNLILWYEYVYGLYSKVDVECKYLELTKNSVIILWYILYSIYHDAGLELSTYRN